MREQIDILGREEIVERVINLVSEITKDKKNSTFTIDGEWGSGKTFVLDLIEKKLQLIQSEDTADNKYMVFHYNCWEYDYYDEPLIAIVSAMLEKAEKESELINDTEEFTKATWDIAKEELKNIAGEFVKNKIGVNLIQVFDDINDKRKSNQEEKYQFDALFSFKKTINETRNILRKLAVNESVIIVVDELDRCLPVYAIKVLERLHHLFYNIENIITIIAVDSSQLQQSIKITFGSNVDIENYLKKFIDFNVDLNRGRVNDKFWDKYEYILDMYSYSDSELFQVKEIALVFFDGIDIRKQEKIMNKLETIHKIICNSKVDISILGFELIWINESYNRRNVDLRVFTHRHINLINDNTKRSNFVQSIKKQVTDDLNHIAEKDEYYYLRDGVMSKIWWYLASVSREENEMIPSLSAGLYNKNYERDKENVDIIFKIKELSSIIK